MKPGRITAAAVFAAILLFQSPTYADEFPPNRLPTDPARPGWKPTIQRPLPIDRFANSSSIFIPFDGGLAPDPLNIWQRGWGWSPWGENPKEIPLPVVPPINMCRTIASDVPGPLPALGIGVMFGYSRRLRHRIKNCRPIPNLIK